MAWKPFTSHGQTPILTQLASFGRTRWPGRKRKIPVDERPEFADSIKALGKEFDGDQKKFEWVAKHYYDLFAYHAAQRLTAFNFFVVSLSFFSNAYATLLAKDDSSHPLNLVAAGLAGAAYLLVIAFGRLDKRNEQIIEINEVPLKQIQAVFDHRYQGGGIWQTFERSDEDARPFRTFGRLLPRIYLLAAIMMAAGVALGLVRAKCISVGMAWGLLGALSAFSWAAIQRMKGRTRKESQRADDLLTRGAVRLSSRQ